LRSLIVPDLEWSRREELGLPNKMQNVKLKIQNTLKFLPDLSLQAESYF